MARQKTLQKPKVGTPWLIKCLVLSQTPLKWHGKVVKGRELGYENVTFGGPSREVAEEAQLEESQEKSCKEIGKVQSTGRSSCVVDPDPKLLPDTDPEKIIPDPDSPDSE